MDLKKMIPEALLSRARSLEPLGLQEIAWTRADALELLVQVADKDIAVLGGDVYNVTALGHLKPAHESWSCERRIGESLGAYSERSQRSALAFLQNYPESPEHLFVLVLSQEETAGSH